MKLIETPFRRLFVMEYSQIQDERGYFERVFCRNTLATAGFEFEIVQANHTLTRERGSIRGMHYQLPPHAEDKIIRCLRGSVYDVVVDCRAGSPTFLKYFGVELREDVPKALLVPKGFAHGFQVLEANSEMLYFHSASYAKESERAVNFADPRIAISWPLPAASISKKDSETPFLTADFQGIAL